MKYREDDYIYGSTRVKALENHAVGADRVARAADQRTLSDALRIFEEGGLRLGSGVETSLSALIADAYHVLGEVAPDPAVFLPLRYIYDCHNIKSVIKCSLRGIDAASLLSPVGTVEPSALVLMARERDFHGLPHNMNDVIPSVYERYYRNSDPREIDFALDKACYLDMAEAAKASECDFMVKWVRIRADLTNLMTAVRIIRIGSNEELFERVFVPSGELNRAFFTPAFASESKKEAETVLFTALSHSPYSALTLTVGDSLTKLERACDNFKLGYVNSEKSGKLYGAAVLTGYVQSRETEAQNIRIIIAGREANLPSEIVKERLRAF